MPKGREPAEGPNLVEVPVYFSATAQWVARVEHEARRRGRTFDEFVREAADQALSSGESRKSRAKLGVG